MAEVLFINDVYIKKYTSINGSVDPNLLYPSIVLAQEKYLMPYLGTNLYNKLKDDVANDTVSGNYAVLLEEYCYKVLLWYTVVEVLPSLTYKIDNGTMVQHLSDDAQPVQNSTLTDFIDRARNNADFYRQRLVDYLCAYGHLFPEYSNNVWPDKAPMAAKSAQTTYVFSTGNTATSTQGEKILYNQIFKT
jgi:hypothetical protein